MFGIRVLLKVFAEFFAKLFWLLQLVEAVAATSAAAAKAQITAAATDANKSHRSQVAAVRKWTHQKLKFPPKNHELFIPSCCLFIHPLKAEKGVLTVKIFEM